MPHLLAGLGGLDQRIGAGLTRRMRGQAHPSRIRGTHPRPHRHGRHAAIRARRRGVDQQAGDRQADPRSGGARARHAGARSARRSRGDRPAHRGRRSHPDVRAGADRRPRARVRRPRRRRQVRRVPLGARGVGGRSGLGQRTRPNVGAMGRGDAPVETIWFHLMTDTERCPTTSAGARLGVGRIGPGSFDPTGPPRGTTTTSTSSSSRRLGLDAPDTEIEHHPGAPQSGRRRSDVVLTGLGRTTTRTSWHCVDARQATTASRTRRSSSPTEVDRAVELFHRDGRVVVVRDVVSRRQLVSDAGGSRSGARPRGRRPDPARQWTEPVAFVSGRHHKLRHVNCWPRPCSSRTRRCGSPWWFDLPTSTSVRTRGMSTCPSRTSGYKAARRTMQGFCGAGAIEAGRSSPTPSRPGSPRSSPSPTRRPTRDLSGAGRVTSSTAACVDLTREFGPIRPVSGPPDTRAGRGREPDRASRPAMTLSARRRTRLPASSDLPRSVVRRHGRGHRTSPARLGDPDQVAERIV